MQIVLGDTSVWSLLLRRRRAVGDTGFHTVVDELRRLMAERRVCLCPPVRQELLTGVRDIQSFNRLLTAMSPLPEAPVYSADYTTAAKIANSCLSSGVSCGFVDCLIAAIAIRNNYPLFTTDRDFHRMAEVVNLRIHGLDAAAS